MVGMSLGPALATAVPRAVARAAAPVRSGADLVVFCGELVCVAEQRKVSLFWGATTQLQWFPAMVPTSTASQTFPIQLRERYAPRLRDPISLGQQVSLTTTMGAPPRVYHLVESGEGAPHGRRLRWREQAAPELFFVLRAAAGAPRRLGEQLGLGDAVALQCAEQLRGSTLGLTVHGAALVLAKLDHGAAPSALVVVAPAAPAGQARSQAHSATAAVAATAGGAAAAAASALHSWFQTATSAPAQPSARPPRPSDGGQHAPPRTTPRPLPSGTHASCRP